MAVSIRAHKEASKQEVKDALHLSDDCGTVQCLQITLFVMATCTAHLVYNITNTHPYLQSPRNLSVNAF